MLCARRIRRLRRIMVACLSLRLRLLRILIAGLLRLRGVAGRRLLAVIGRRLLARISIQAVPAVLGVTGRRIVPAGGILTVEDAAHDLAHALAELGQELDGVFILPLRLLRITVAGSWLLVTGRRGWLAVLRLRITTGWRLRVVTLLALGLKR